MKLLYGILDYNKKFVNNKYYEKYQTEDKYPSKEVVILTCMDTRLVELATKALNFSTGDVKIIKNAGAILSHPYDSVMRSLIIAVYSLKAKEIIVMGHKDCGMQNINTNDLIKAIRERGVSEDTLNVLKYSGINLNEWLHGFDNVNDSVEHDVKLIKNHPLLPNEVSVHGLVIDPTNGELTVIKNGYDDNQ